LFRLNLCFRRNFARNTPEHVTRPLSNVVNTWLTPLTFAHFLGLKQRQPVPIRRLATALAFDFGPLSYPITIEDDREPVLDHARVLTESSEQKQHDQIQ
jgi:hypothetical protein